jgi:ABC-type transport system involved in cytochrome c biogenesis permease component
MQLVQTILRLTKKDLVIEIRRGELAVMGALGVIGLSLILAYGVSLASLTPPSRELLAPSLCLAVLLATSLPLVGKFSDYDAESGALHGLLLAGVASEALYISRVISLTITVFCTALVAMLAVPALLGLRLDVMFQSVDPLLVVLGTSVALGATGAVMAPITSRVRVGGMFLLTLLLPLLVPIFFAGCEVLSGEPGTRQFWWTVLAALSAIYVAIGLWLHPYVVGKGAS